MAEHLHGHRWEEAVAIDHATADANSETFVVDKSQYAEVVAYVYIDGTATVRVQAGCCCDNEHWITLGDAITQTEIKKFDTHPHMRVRATNVSGTVTVVLRFDTLR